MTAPNADAPKRVKCPGCGAMIDPATGDATYTASGAPGERGTPAGEMIAKLQTRLDAIDAELRKIAEGHTGEAAAARVAARDIRNRYFRGAR